MAFIIYGLCDPRTGELRYIGKTARGQQRYYEHLSVMRKKSGPKSHLRYWLRSLHRRGDRPDFFVIEDATDGNALSIAEIELISYFKAVGCNLVNNTLGGDGASGHKHSAATRKRISEVQKGVPKSSEQRELISKTLTGRTLSAAHRAALSKAGMGRISGPMTAEQKMKISRMRGGRPFKDQNGNTYISLTDVHKRLNVNPSEVAKVLKGVIKHTKGYTFSYLETEKAQ